MNIKQYTMKLKAKTRFLNAMDAQIYNEGDEFTVKSQDDADYFVNYNLAEHVKEEKAVKETKEFKEEVKTKKAK